MTLSERYNELFKNSSELILSENYIIDSKINDTSDKRFGLTLLLRPSEEIKTAIKAFLKDVKKSEPQQYYYPNSDIHITVMSIISCYEGFTLDTIAIENYIEIIQQSLVDLNEIKINMRGVTASNAAIMIQGFPVDESLTKFRNTLRKKFKNSVLEQSMDSRYEIATAHSTVIRFTEELQNPDKLIETLDQFRDYNFGEFTVEKLELVYNDWYQRKENTISLCDFYLRSF